MKNILQLIKKENNQEYKDIYPKTYTDAVLDKHTGANLADILNSFNMYFIAYAGSKEVTRVLVPTNLRRKGLWITYIMLDDTIVTEYYNGSLLTDDAWLDSANWVNSIQPFDKFSKKNMTCRFDNFTDKSTSSKLMTVKQGGEIVFSTTDNRFYYLHRDVLYDYWEVKGKPSNTEFQYKDSVYTDKLFLCKDRAYVMYNGTLVDIARFTIDKELSLTSNNPIANSTVTKKINEVNADATTALTLARELKEEGRFLINGNVTNNPDEEDITVEENKLKFKDKVYNAGEFSGLGRVYLRKNIVNGKNVLTQEMINKPNTIYIIQYNYDLNNIQITIQENCILKFEGGSFSNGILSGNKTVIEALPYQIFNNINVLGTYNIEYSYCEWIGAKGDGISDDSNFIQKCLNYFYTVKLLPNTKYFITKNIEIKTYRTLIGDKSSIIKANGTFKLFKLGHTSKLYGFSIFMEKPQTVIIITSKYIKDSYFEIDKTPNAWRYVSDANILVRDLNIIALNEDDLTSDINCIESLANGEGIGFWQVFMDNIKIHGKYNYAIYINNGQKAGINFATWQTDSMFRDIKINKCFNGIYIGSDDEIGAYNHFPPEAITFDNVSMQHYDYSKHFAVLTNCNKIVFKNCQPWDWINPKDIFYINPNKTPDLRIEGIYNNSQYSLFTFSESLNKDENFKVKISSNRDGINDIFYDLAFMYTEEELNKRATCGLLRRLTSGIYMIYSDLKYNTFFGVTNDDFIGFHFGPYLMEVIHYRNNIFIRFIGQYLKEFNEQGFIVIKSDYADDKELPKINYYQQKIKTFDTIEDFKQTNSYKYNYFGFVKEPNNNVPKLIYKLLDQYYVESDGREFSPNFGSNFPTLNKDYLNSLGKCFYNTVYNKVFFFSKNGEWRDGEGNLPGINKKGTTAQRPTGVQIGFIYKDTNLNKWIIWNGEAWENIDGTALG